MNKIKYQELSVDLDFVVIIDCLSENERKVWAITAQLQKDLEDLEINIVTGLFKDKSKLLKFLSELLSKAEAGSRFWITIISHGNQKCIGFKESGELVPWIDLAPYFQKINNALENSLVLNMMSCFGLHGIKMADIKNELFPCYGLLGSGRELSPSNAKLINKKIYEKISQGKSIDNLIPEIQNEIKKETGEENVIYCISSKGYSLIEKYKQNYTKK